MGETEVGMPARTRQALEEALTAEPETGVRTEIPGRVIRGDKDELPERAGVTITGPKGPVM